MAALQVVGVVGGGRLMNIGYLSVSLPVKLFMVIFPIHICLFNIILF